MNVEGWCAQIKVKATENRAELPAIAIALDDVRGQLRCLRLCV